MTYMFIYSIVILVFAMLTMVLLLRIQPAMLVPAKRRLLYWGLVLIVISNIVTGLFFMQRFPALYPLLVHLPLVILLCIVSGRGLPKVIFVLLTTIILSYPPALAFSIARSIFHLSKLWTIVVSALACAAVFAAVWRTMARGFSYMMEFFGTKEILQFCTVPFGYNILIYLLGQYRQAVTLSILRIVLFLSALGVYFLIMGTIQNAQNIQRLKGEGEMLGLLLESSKQQFDQLKATEHQTAIYRHDIRHHVMLLDSFASEGDLQKIKEYLCTVEGNIDSATPRLYCKNTTANLILSSFDQKAKQMGVTLQTEVALPEMLSVNDNELCALLSNALENAITAAAQMKEEKLRRVYIRAVVSDGKLVLSTENAYVGEISMEGELPKTTSKEAGHGLGIKSMVAIVERHNGLYSFETADGVFILQLMLPLGKAEK